jgi:Zn-dependent M16 (insulinase) family peptidase
LHEHIREKGGAYGSGLHVRDHGVMFNSYRDPSPDAALRVFNQAAAWLMEQADQGDEAQLDGARLTVVQKIVDPGDGRRGLVDAVENLKKWQSPAHHHEAIQALREVSWQDVRAFAELLVPGVCMSQDITEGPQKPEPVAKPKQTRRP